MTPGRILIVFGIIVVAIGALIEFAPSLRLGRLPGDISFGGQDWRVYLPIGTSILFSVVLSAIFALISYFGSRK